MEEGVFNGGVQVGCKLVGVSHSPNWKKANSVCVEDGRGPGAKEPQRKVSCSVRFGAGQEPESAEKTRRRVAAMRYRSVAS